MSKHPHRLVPPAVAVLTIASVALAHKDDPKGKVTPTPYPGTGWRAAEGGAAAGGGFDFDGVTLRSWITLEEFTDYSGDSQDDANDCWGYVSPSGREYALMGLQDGTAFVEVTDPDNAQIIDYKDGPNSVWRDLKVYQHYAYAVSEHGDGIQVFDLSDIDNGNVNHIRNVTTGGSEATHNVALNEESGYLYRAGGSGNGIRIYSLLDDPSDPTYVNEFSDVYVHDCQVTSYTEGPYAGREIAFLCGGYNGGGTETGLYIVDVTDKADLELIGVLLYSNPGYSHQGWLSDDKQYFYLNDETHGLDSVTYILDVSDLENPFEADTYTNGVNAGCHNLYTRGNLLFAANYTSGLRVYDITERESPEEVAYFDTHPDDGHSYTSLWSNYPLFPSGTILGSDRQRGLFVWTYDDDVTPSDPDVNGDGFIDVEDLVMVILNWGPCPPECPADVDGDGEVGVADLVEVILNFG
jgi:choice-of-anchor B domain-containing protein